MRSISRMKRSRIVLHLLPLLLAAAVLRASAQTLPRIEESACIYSPDGVHKTRCGYLLVPEDRKHPNSSVIKLPFVYVESNNPNRSPDPVLYTGGGPGVSSLHPVTSIDRRSLLRDRDYIAFEQRGAHFAIPNLECVGPGSAVQQAYLDHRTTDAAVLDAVRRCQATLIRKGVDLSAYNTDASADDIEDLRRLLKIDSLNLMGISYSGGLMMAVLQKYPQHIRSLVLDSPLPEFINIDEQELANFNEALTQVLDGADNTLTTRFRSYFSSLTGKTFTLQYQLKDGKAVTLQYGRRELLSVIHAKIEDYDDVKELPGVVNDMISGHHERYMKEYFDGVFSGDGSLSGMRLSVYCSDKMAFEDPSIIQQQDIAMPWLAGFYVNDVHQDMCQAWNVNPIEARTKQTFYSSVPALLGAGGLDDACRPLYNDMIHHYLFNSQRLLFTKRQHGPLLNSYEGDTYIATFLTNPAGRLASQKDIEDY
jgi:pimeloyl-ACP methyl ester carboxylesterase